MVIYFRKMEGRLPLAEIRVALSEGEEARTGLGPAGGLAPAYRMHQKNAHILGLKGLCYEMIIFN